MPTAKRQIVVVLGMHRSGTSATAGLLNLLGASEPRHLMPPTADNPKGYWESVRLMQFHDELLTACGSSWDDWWPLPEDLSHSAVGSEARARIPALLADEFGDAPVPLLKDPRLCRLFPVWSEALSEQGIEPLAVLPIRQAMAVARSLEARDGLALDHGLLLWLRHVLDAELHTRALTRTVVSYDDLLTDWRPEVDRMARELHAPWMAPSDQTALAVEELLERSLRHQGTENDVVTVHGQLLHDWIETVSHAMAELGRPGGDSAQALRLLDDVRSELDRASSPFTTAARDALVRLRSSESKARVESDVQRDQLVEARRTLKARQTALEVAEKDLEQHKQAVASQAARLSELEGQLVLQHHLNAERIDELARLTRRMLRAEGQAKKVSVRRKKEVRRARTRVARLQKKVAAQHHEIQAMRDSSSWRVTAPVRAVSSRLRSARPVASTSTGKD